MLEALGWYDFLVLGALGVLIYFAFNQEKRMKVQDRQFRMLLSRLNQLTGREINDYSSELDDLESAEEQALKDFLRKK